jgi:NAD(P)-dependent dehydrogenase (short-subunit alcohol dehydrogenase family)
MTDFEGQVALVTGAGRGIGRECSLELARRGAHVFVVSRSRQELDTLVQTAAEFGAETTPMVCDVTDPAAVRDLIGSLKRVNVLIQCAGTNIPERFLDVSEEHLEQLLAVNVKAVFRVAQGAARIMMAKGTGGSIVTIGSQMGHVGAPNRTVYCATKHAVEGLTKALAIELAPHAIRVNTVAPTFIETALTAPFFADQGFRDEVQSKIPLGRIGTPADVSEAVLFLASPRAQLITGASLRVDGGWTAQ